jgi:hypothetical protein
MEEASLLSPLDGQIRVKLPDLFVPFGACYYQENAESGAVRAWPNAFTHTAM